MPALFKRDVIEAQQQSLSNVSRFPFMRFMPELEAAFEQFRYQRLSKRVPIIGISGLVLFCVFSILDLFTLPLAVAQISIPIRLFLICPLIILIMYLAAKKAPARLFLSVYLSVYLISGVAIVAIIYIADIHDFLLAYDGILLHLVFGYFVMSLPYTLAIYGGLIISIVYLVLSYQMNLQVEQLASNSIFIIGLNFIGAVGCYIQERARRFLFLNEQLVSLAKEKDKKEIESKTRLVATASHDLRQPLHAMHLLIETLGEQLPKGEQRDIVSSLDISIKQLSQLLNTLLDISKLSAGIVEPNVETIDLAEKVAGCCQEQRLRFLEAGIELTYTEAQPVLIRADSLLLDRIIRNVIENVFIHSEATKVSISWELNQGKACLSIQDNGKGIPEADLDSIFDEFQQANEYTSIGMGLGLSIVKQLAELQGIEHGLNSEVGHGSCFWFKIPLSQGESIPENKSLIHLSVIQAPSSSFTDKWSQHLQSWGYSVSLLPINESNHVVKEISQIKTPLSNTPQLLIIDIPANSDMNHDKEDLLKWLEIVSEKTSILFLIAPNTTGFQYLEENGYDYVQDNIRPAKLRLILQHLRSSN